MNGKMTDQVVLITGGAGGIGTEVSRAVAEAGAHVVLVGRRPEEELQAVARTLPGEGHLGIRASVDDSADVVRMAGEVEARYGRLDVLVNNAAITRLIPHDDLDALDDALIDEIFRVNWRGAFACVRAFRRLLEAGPGGVIINMTSNAGITGQGSNIAYCASKAAINTMTLSLARALAPKIRVLAIAPGFVDTGFVTRDPAWVERAAKMSLMGVAVPPDALGAAVVAAVTDLPYSTGCIIPVDAGRG